MKKNLLRVFAMVAAFLILGPTMAQAVNIEWGGQIRPRWEIRDQDFNDDSDEVSFFQSRVRVNSKVTMDDRTSAFIQLQSVRTWGETGGGTATGAQNPAGSGNAALSPSDADTSVGVHQAYFTLKKFFNLPADLQVGRQEVVLDGHRLVGNTGWTQGAQTHDAIRIDHAEGNHHLLYVYSKVSEDGTVQDDTDIDAHIFWGNLKGILGGAFSLYFIYVDDDSLDTAGFFTPTAGTLSAPAGTPILTGSTNPFTDTADVDNDLFTVGFRQAGQLWGIDYRGEFYYQFGDAAGLDRQAYMAGVRVGKKWNFAWQPTTTIWYDYLSGDDNAGDGDFETFNTLFDTGHKYYGFMDLFLPATGANTDFLGLQDLAFKFSIKPLPKLTAKADIHVFWTAEDALRPGSALGSTTAVTAGKLASDEDHLGEELDLTFKYAYNPFVAITVGYSHFFADDLMAFVGPRDTTASAGGGAVTETISSGPDDADWAYVMFDVKW